MPAPQTFKELQDWLKSEIIKITAAANKAVEDGNMTHDQAMVVHAENVAMITSKAVNRALEMLHDVLAVNPETTPEDKDAT